MTQSIDALLSTLPEIEARDAEWDVTLQDEPLRTIKVAPRQEFVAAMPWAVHDRRVLLSLVREQARELERMREAVMMAVHDLESWRAVELNFESRKLIDDATKRLRAAAQPHQEQT